MKITIIGSGYVGLVSAICLAKIGHNVISVDNDKEKIDNLNRGIVPIFEPNLTELLSEVKALQKITFTANLEQAIIDCDAIFIAVGTPQGQDGSADLTFIFEVAKQIAINSRKPQIIITKSTVPAGTGAKIEKFLAEIAPNIEFSVVSPLIEVPETTNYLEAASEEEIQHYLQQNDNTGVNNKES